ncbi:MAG TPA: arginine--tRNA ligase [Kouleothrix sp.]|uniref:arginine--tRNA ligase n=1 Tax=Kouleothrix sp. TaxID=2779161 RepID=UPI002D1DADE0|nr:arginine--tRNA ligase [Kouleothrix sp.]
MDYALDRFEQQVRDAIAATGQVPGELVDLTAPKPNIPADLALPAFKAAKALGVPPPQLAQALAQAIQLPEGSLVGAVAAAGPFLNFTLHPARLAAAVLDEVEELGPRYGSDDIGAGKTVVVDYSSPNVAKLMHVGHIRSTIIGQSLYNIFQFLGYRTIGDNHLGDWGKQFGMNIAAIVRWGKPQGEGEEALAQLDKLYAQYVALAKDDPALDDEARAWSLKLEQGDPTARELWQWMVDLTISANRRNYDLLGVHFDHIYGESFYEGMLPDVIGDVLAKKVAYRDEGGAVVVDLGSSLPTFLLQRSDGGTLYHTRDVATVLFRLKEFSPAKIVYVVGMPQELHFRQLFALVRAMGYAEDVELEHIKFGTVFDQHGAPLSTRRGNMIYLADLLDDAHQRARAVVDQASPELSDAEKDEVAEIVGVGSVVYNDLYQDPRRNITLDWERMLALEGNSAPYIQYMYARCRSIVRKAAAEDQGRRTKEQLDGAAASRPASSGEGDTSLILGSSPGNQPAGNPALLAHPSELAVIKQLAKLPGAVREAGARYAPFVVAEWCYDTARALSGFYRDCSVLKAETPELRAARLRLVEATAQALKNGLGLLGLRAPERM